VIVAVLAELRWFEKGQRKKKKRMKKCVGGGRWGACGLTGGSGWLWLVPIDAPGHCGSNGGG
jgi:hypothetical protein